MPRACPADRYAPCYSGDRANPRSECLGLAPTIVTLLATAVIAPILAPNASGLPRGSLRSLLQRRSRQSSLRMPRACPADRYAPCYSGDRANPRSECLGLAPRIVTLLATAAIAPILAPNA